MKRPDNGLLSFGGNLHTHHFATEQDVADELFALLSEAREPYLRDVITNGKRYDRYVADFVNSHRYIDCNKAVCRNCHEMNIHIVRGLLRNCPALIKSFFTADAFSLEDCMRLKREYDFRKFSPGSPGAESSVHTPSLSFGCNFSGEQMKSIVACATAYHLFRVSTLRIEDMEALFACREGFCIRVNNVRHVAILFDALLEHRLIQPYWQSVLDKGRFLLAKDGSKHVSASNLSTALSAARIRMTSVAHGIRKAVAEMTGSAEKPSM